MLAEKTAHFAKRDGVTYGRITIREQKTRWGSCSSAGNLNYNWKLVLMPEHVMDYVVIHELAHRKEMNHSARFLRGGGTADARLQSVAELAEGAWKRVLKKRGKTK